MRKGYSGVRRKWVGNKMRQARDRWCGGRYRRDERLGLETRAGWLHATPRLSLSLSRGLELDLGPLSL